MASITDIRKQYPAYNDLSDQQLADALYQTHYSDMPREQFDVAVGVRPKKSSQTLGFMEGVTTPLSKLPANPLNYIPGLDARGEGAKALSGTKAYFTKREQTERPGVVGRVAGEVVGTLPVAAVIRNPFALGAAQGALTSEAKDVGGVATDAAIGGVLGHYGGKAVDAVADVIKPAIDPAVKMLHDAGVKLTPGMIKGGKFMAREDKAMSRPGVGEKITAGRQRTQETWNTATVNQALEPLGVKVPAGIQPGHDAVAFAHDAVSQAYDQVIPNLSVNLNTRTLAGKLAGPAASLPKPQQLHLQSILTNTIGKGQLTGQPLKNAQGELRRLASAYSSDASAPNREMGRLLWQADEELSQTMLSQNPVWAPELQKANAAFRGLRTVEDAASRADDGVFNTGQLKQSVRRGDKSAGKNASARGDAFMQDWSNASRGVIPAVAPNPSGTAGHVMSGNLFANFKGRLEGAGYDVGNLFQQTRLAPRPAAAEPVARTVRRLRGPAVTGAVSSRNGDR